MTAARTARMLIAATLVAALLVVAGCGEGSGRGDENRPPLPIVIAIQIGDDEVTGSPNKIGAGPFTLIASNQTKFLQKMKIEGPRLERILPVDANDTAKIKVTLEPGEYTLTTGAADKQTKPFTLQVGEERATTQPRLLLP